MSGKLRVLMGKVMDNLECCYWGMCKGAVEVAGNVSASAVVQDDHHGSEVSGSHLPVECLLNGGVVYQDEVSFLKVKVADDCRMFSLESECGAIALFVNLIMEPGKVVLLLL